MTTNAIDIKNLSKSFGEHSVIRELDIEVKRGEVFALLGPNGSGKTTTINVLTTLIPADRGKVLVAGFDVRSQPVEVQRRISLTGQAAAVDDALSATENVVMFARLAGLNRSTSRRRATELIEQFQLHEAASRPVKTFSGGMRRRLDLALSFVVTPEVLFLDEPTTGLDTRSRRDVWEMIRALAAAGTTVFLTTQYLEEADQLADRIAVLHGGRVVALGTASELKARIGGDAVEIHDDHGELVHSIPTDGSLREVRRALDELDEHGVDGTVSLRHPTLDDVFLALTSHDHTGPTVQTVQLDQTDQSDQLIKEYS